MAAQLKAGDVVVLNSGGPNMTVTKVESDVVTCQWFDGKKLCTEEFPATSLTKPDFSAQVWVG